MGIYYYRLAVNYARGLAGYTTMGLSDALQASTVIVNNAPTLDWTGEANYLTDGLDPETGTVGVTTFTYRVEYTDSDNDAPTSIEVYIEQPQGTPVGGSPFAMTEVDPLDVTYTDGKLYTYATTLPVVATDYVYKFNASDGFDWATGAPTAFVDAPDVIGNTAPTLDWTGELNYVTDGLDPESGVVAVTTFTYRVEYTDADNDAPTSVEVYIEQPQGTPVGGSPFAMTEVDPLDVTYTDGKLYTYATTLPAVATDYVYKFNASDGTDWATGAPTAFVDAPDVSASNNAPTLDWTGEANYVTDGLDPETGTVSVTTFTYRVEYTDADNNPPSSIVVYIEQPQGTPVGASPFAMLEVDPLDVTYTDGKLYTYSTTLPAVATDYVYKFNASDGTDWATGTPTGFVDAPDVSAPDTTAPSMTTPTTSPSTPDTDDSVTVTITVTDADVVTVTIIVEDPDGNTITSIDNVTMPAGTGADVYEYTISNTVIDMAGTWAFTIWANDSSGNYNSTIVTFVVTEAVLTTTYIVTVTVTDPDGALISDAKVSIKNSAGTEVASGDTHTAGQRFSHPRARSRPPVAMDNHNHSHNRDSDPPYMVDDQEEETRRGGQARGRGRGRGDEARGGRGRSRGGRRGRSCSCSHHEDMRELRSRDQGRVRPLPVLRSAPDRDGTRSRGDRRGAQGRRGRGAQGRGAQGRRREENKLQELREGDSSGLCDLPVLRHQPVITRRPSAKTDKLREV
jgi:hypothetical protein